MSEAVLNFRSTGHCKRLARHSDRGILGRHFLSAYMCRVSTLHRRTVQRLWPSTTSYVLTRAFHARIRGGMCSAELCDSARRPMRARYWRWWDHSHEHGHLHRRRASSVSAQMVWSHTRSLGIWKYLWPSVGGRNCPTYNMAMDLLHELSSLRYWLGNGLASGAAEDG